MTDNQQPTVLVVDDEEAYVDAYATWLSERYEVRTATGGFEALDELDRSVDVVLLDRRMPRLSGDEVLAEIRERGFDCRVGMITAVEPDVDIVEMAFDEYLVKPVSKDDLTGVVEELLRRDSLDSHLQECFSLVSKKAVLETTLEAETLERSSEYQELLKRLEATETRADETLSDLLETGDIAAVYNDIEG